MTEDESIQIAFVCVQNAGRSQMASAFAQREVDDRDLTDEVTIVTGGTRPAAQIHPAVRDSMAALGIDLSGRSPRAITSEELQNSAYVITMGCAANDVCPAGWVGESRDWALADPDDCPAAEVATIRDEIEQRVAELFDELAQEIQVHSSSGTGNAGR